MHYNHKRNGGKPLKDQKQIRLGVMLICLFVCTGLRAADTWGQDSLRGVQEINKVSVSMAYCPDFIIALSGLGTDRLPLQNDIELKLRLARISTDAAKVSPLLTLNVHCLPITVGGQQLGYALHMQLNVQQYVFSEDNKQHTLAATWQTVDSQICSKDSCPLQIRSMAKDMVDELVGDLLKANRIK